MRHSERRTHALLNGPMTVWTVIGSAERAVIETEAAGIAERAARLSAYLTARNQGGSHGAAVKRQNETAAKVRAALGYTYKHNPITF